MKRARNILFVKSKITNEKLVKLLKDAKERKEKQR